MPNSAFSYPFGRPVRPCKPSASEPKRLFVLGAYPSALHVEWVPPKGYRRIRAIAVDNEPEPFWSGADQEARIEQWKRTVKFDAITMGEVRPAGGLNGSSGAWVDENVLAPLGARRGDAWITDALDTYRCSTALAARIRDTYDAFAAATGLPSARLQEHPSEREIIDEALAQHRRRLLRELEACNPDQIVTLGNAALAVVLGLVPRTGGPKLRRLSADEGYGAPVVVQLGTRDVELLPLAHPAAPPRYQDSHRAWCASRSRRRARG